MGKQLSIFDAEPEPAVDHARTALAVKSRRARSPLPVIGELFEVERPPIRSKRIKTSAPRLLREGDRPQSLGSTPLTREERRDMELDVWALPGVRFGPPPTFGSCRKSGPCVHVGCRHNNYLEVSGDIVKLNHPGIGPEEMKEPCSLRVAIRGSKRAGTKGPDGQVLSHDEVSECLGLTPERTRQLETVALRKFKREREDLR